MRAILFIALATAASAISVYSLWRDRGSVRRFDAPHVRDEGEE